MRLRLDVEAESSHPWRVQALPEEHPKIARAQQLLAEFNAACAAFVGTDPYRIIERQKQGVRTVRIEFDRAPPGLGAIFGDFVHNLRSALDHTVRTLVEGNSEERRRSSFPILIDGNQWADAPPGCMNGGFAKVAGLDPEAIRAIERLQPYNVDHDPEWHPLVVLQGLDNRDKHRELNLTVAFVHHVGGTTGSGYWFGPPPPTSDDGMLELVVANSRPDIKPTLAISLSREGPAANAILWRPYGMPARLLEIMGETGHLLPDFLLASVIGIVRMLEAVRN
jgi:hypothetical protein